MVQRAAALVVVLLLVLTGCAPVPKQFDGIRIIFFVGGDPGDPFSDVIERGARDAATNLGAEVEFVHSNWDETLMAQQFRQAVQSEPDGIAMMGHPGEQSLRPFVDDAESRGIVVTTQNVDLPTLEETYRADGLGYVGQGTYSAGYGLATSLVRSMRVAKGSHALVMSFLTMPGRGDRSRGVLEGFSDAGMIVQALDFTTIWEDSELSYQRLSSYLDAHPDTKVIVADTQVPELVRWFQERSIDPSQYAVGAFDLTQRNVRWLEEGYIDVLSDQQPYLQGYLPVLQICLSVKYGFSGLHVETSSGFVNRSNLDEVKDLVEQGIR